MTRNPNIAIVFSQALRLGLLSKYREIPSSGFVAKEFNLRAKNTSTITPETARRWLNGQVVPDLDKLITLSGWLGINLNTLLSINKVSENLETDLAHQEIKEFINNSEKVIHSLHDITNELEVTIKKLQVLTKK